MPAAPMALHAHGRPTVPCFILASARGRSPCRRCQALSGAEVAGRQRLFHLGRGPAVGDDAL